MGQQFPFDHFFQQRQNSLKEEQRPAIQKHFLFDLDESIQNTRLEQQSITNFIQETSSLSENDKKIETNEETALINSEIHKQIKQQISKEKYITFFESTFKLISFGTTELRFAVSTQFIKIMIEGHYLNIIQNAAQEILNRKFLIVLEVAGSQMSPAVNKNNLLNNLRPYPQENENKLEIKKDQLNNDIELRPKSAKDVKFTLDLTPTRDDLISKVESTYIGHTRPETIGISIDPKKNFENFVVGPSNNMAYAMAKAVAELPNMPGKKGKYPSLYFYGNSGLGKTHLLHSIANNIREKYPTLSITMISARDFSNELIEAIKTNTQEKFQRRYRERIDVLMIDDIQELKGKPATQDEFFHVFNEMYSSGKQLVFTSDKMPKEIDGLPERIQTRLEWGLVIDIQKPDIETRIAILKNKALELDIYVPEEAQMLIANSIKNSIRELEGALMKLSAFADVMQTDIDVEMVKENLSLIPSERTSEITIDHIARSTSLFFKIPLPDIKSKSRNNEITQARHIAMYLSKKCLNCTYEEIGRYFGGRHHSTVIHAIKEISEQTALDESLLKSVRTIESAL